MKRYYWKHWRNPVVRFVVYSFLTLFVLTVLYAWMVIASFTWL